MVDGPAERALQRAVQACYTDQDDFAVLRGELLRTLRKAVPFDAAFVATADPETLLFTSAFADDSALAASAQLFIDNEFGNPPDVNRFADLARGRDPVATLDQATRSEWATSARWRDIMQPLGMGDELRVALRVDGTVWGYMCLHRCGATSFTAKEATALRTFSTHGAHAIRRHAALASQSSAGPSPEAVILVEDGLVRAIGGVIEELDFDGLRVAEPLPVVLAAVVRRLETIESGVGDVDGETPTVRITSRSGAILAVLASRLRDASGRGPVLLTVAPPTPSSRSALLLAAHGLSPAQRRVANLVLQGRTTRQIAVEAGISAHTVQDHLKAVFDKTGVRSRRDLVNLLMRPGG